MRRCIICREEGHNKTKCSKSNEIVISNIPKVSKEKIITKDIQYDVEDGTLLTIQWQHLEKEHDYDYVLFVLLDFTGFKVWAIDKQTLIGDLIEKKILCLQGEQGYWGWKSDLMPHLTEIKTIRDLDDFISK
jgi:hypothetical protein